MDVHINNLHNKLIDLPVHSITNTHPCVTFDPGESMLSSSHKYLPHVHTVLVLQSAMHATLEKHVHNIKMTYMR